MQQQRPHPAILARNSSAPAAMATTNPAGLPYSGVHNNQHNNNHNHSNMQPTMPMTQLPQHQQYQQGRIVSPVVSPTLAREQIIVTPNTHPVHLVQNQHSPVNFNHNAMAWQHRQQQQQHPPQLQIQINTARSYESDDVERIDEDSDVSTVHMGSIRPDPKYDPAKDPTSPENINVPFVAPLEITIRVVKARRYKTLSSYHSSTTHTSHTTQSTAITPPHSSAVEEEKHPTALSDWLQTPEIPTTQTGSGSIPQLGPINSFVSDATDSNSFSGSMDQFQSAEDIMHLEEDMLELQGMQEGHKTEETKQRKGMVRREFNRRIMRFKKGKKKNKNSSGNNNNNVNTSNEFSGDDDDLTSDASGNKIIIKLKINDDANNNKMLHAPEQQQQQQPKQHFKSKNLYPTSFGGMLKHHRRSDSMKMIVGQENGC